MTTLIGQHARVTFLATSVFVVSLASSGAAIGGEERRPGVNFELGGGGVVAPSFEGSKRYMLTPYPLFRLSYLELDNGFSIGGGDGQGLSVHPSFRYLAARKAADDPVLAGLPDTEDSVELGGGLTYAVGSYSAFADVRYGATGHNGFVGEIGADYTLKPNQKTTLKFGPRLSWASGEYMNTYFGVSAGSAAASGFRPFDAEAGIKSIGVEASARFDVNESWALEAGAGYGRLVGDAAASPIVAAGTKNQLTGKIGVVRKFSLGF